MTPSTWPALIVGAFTILNPSTNVGPATAETDAAPVTITATQPAFPPSDSSSDYKLGLAGILPAAPADPRPTVTIAAPTTVTEYFNDGTTYSYTINVNGPYVVPNPSDPKTFFQNVDPSPGAIDHMPIIGYGGDPNKMDHMCWWDGTDPNRMDHMAYGYDPATTKFFGAQQTQITLDNTLKDRPKLFSPPPPPPSAIKPVPSPAK